MFDFRGMSHFGHKEDKVVGNAIGTKQQLAVKLQSPEPRNRIIEHNTVTQHNVVSCTKPAFVKHYPLSSNTCFIGFIESHE